MKMGVFFFGENSIRKNHYIFDSLRVECVAPYTSGRDCIINLFKVIGAVFHSESNWMQIRIKPFEPSKGNLFGFIALDP